MSFWLLLNVDIFASVKNGGLMSIIPVTCLTYAFECARRYYRCDVAIAASSAWMLRFFMSVLVGKYTRARVRACIQKIKLICVCAYTSGWAFLLVR